MPGTNEQIVMKVSSSTIIGNGFLTAFKLFAGLYGNSAAMLSDALHSLSDVLSTVIVMVGFKLSNKNSDKEHQYGHERLECVAALILAAILFAVGISIGWNGVQKILSRNYETLAIPGIFALVAAIISVVSKEIMYQYTKSAAKKINSGALLADAWHHRSDALSSIGSFIGILGARLGFPVLDSVACVVICIFVLKVSFDIFMDSVDKITDKACNDDVIEEIKKIILLQESVMGIDNIRTRLFGNKIYVDVEICADGNSTLYNTHDIAHRVHDAIESNFQNVKHCMVHVNPAENKK